MIKRKQFKDLLYVKQGKEYLQCSKCGEIKELTEENYYKNDGGKYWILICKDCKKKRYEDKKAEIKVYSKKYREENKEYYKAYAKNYNNGKETTSIKVKDFKQENLPIINKLINSDGEVTTNDGRKFTRLIGGFGEGKPMLLIKDVSTIHNIRIDKLNYKIRNNTSYFEEGRDYIDLKFNRESLQYLLDIELFSKNELNASKNIYLLSKSGYLKLCSCLNVDSEILKEILEIYFNSKENTLIIKADKKEIRFLDILEEALKPFNIKGVRQYTVLKYRIDYYIPSLNIAIEYDENNHKYYSYEEHQGRQKEIEEKIGCRFIRVSDEETHFYNVGYVIKEMFKIN